MKSEQDLRSDLLTCLHAGLAAADPERLVSEALLHEAQVFPTGRRVLVVGFGKAAIGMARGAFKTLGDKIADGVLIAPHGCRAELPPALRVYYGAHPTPDAGSVAGAKALCEMVAHAAHGRAVLLCLISGGGSALLTLPPEEVALEEIQAVSADLMRAGADIRELNCVRKHLDQLKGGRLAGVAAPAPVLALILSDIAGDPLDAIASGPVSPDPTRFADAVAVLQRRGLWETAPQGLRRHLQAGLEGRVDDSPARGDPCFRHVRSLIVGSARTAAEAAIGRAEALGYDTQLLSLELTGEAREVGRMLGQRARAIRQGTAVPEAPAQGPDVPKPPAGLVSAGETTVTIRGEGRGGRNQELVLAAALEISGLEGIALGSLGTDGIDGPTDVAGAVATGSSLRRARACGLDPSKALADNDSYRFFRALDDHIRTGPTGTNVMDLQIVLIDRRADRA